MKAAIYARKSTEDNVADESKSTTRQLANAREFAAARGWTVVMERVDEAVSGATEKRKGLDAVLAGADRHEFTVLIVSEVKSLARELTLGMSLIKRLSQAGVAVYEYGQGRCLTPKNARERMMSALELFGADDYSETTARRVHEGHLRHVKQGHVVGGRVYGYRNHHVYAGVDKNGNPLRSHVEHVPIPEEAAAVLRIFTMYADGHGLKAVAKALTRDRVPIPRPNIEKQSIGVWAPSTVRAILRRDIYGGTIVWGQRKKRDDYKAIHVTSTPEATWTRVEAEHLRLVPEPVFRRARARLEDVRATAIRFSSGKLAGRPRMAAAPKNLLAGFATCGVCGGGLVAETSRGGIRYYSCARRRRHGEHACPGIRVPADAVDAAVLIEVEDHVLRPERVEEFLLAVDRAESEDTARRTRLEGELKDVTKRLTRLVVAVEAGGDATSLVARMKELEAEQSRITTALGTAQPVPRLQPAVVESRLAEWRRILRGSVTQARDVLRRVLAEPLTFRKLPGGITEFEAPTKFSRLFVGFDVEAMPGAPPVWVRMPDGRGHEAGAAVEAQYSAVLEAAEARARLGDRPWKVDAPSAHLRGRV